MKENKPQEAPQPETSAKQKKADKKKAQKATQAQQIALEKQLVKEGKILPRTRYAPKGLFGRVLALMLAFLFGMLAVIGGILGGGYFLAITPSRNLLNFLGLKQELLSEEYLNKSVIDIAYDVRNDINSLTDVSAISLSTFSKYSPVLDNMVSSLVEQVNAYGIPADAEKLSTTPFSVLAAYLMDDVVMKAELGGLMQASSLGDAPLIYALCYGTEGTNEEGGDYQIIDGQVVMNEGKSPRTLGDLRDNSGDIVTSLPLESVLDVDGESSEVIRALSYGTEGINYIIDEQGGIKMLTDPLTGKPYPKHEIGDLTQNDSLIDNITIGSVVSVDENTTGILLAIRDWKLGDLKDASRIESLRISQIITVDDSSAPILKAMKNWRISEMKDAEKVDSLTLGQLIDITEDSAKLLQSLADTPIGDIASAVDSLRLCDILEEEEIDNNKILRNLKMSSLSTLADDVASLTVAQVFGDELYSYLDMSATGGKTYAEIVNGYDKDTNTNTNTADESLLRPTSIKAADLSVTETRVLKDDPATQVLQGYFRKDMSGSAFAPAGALIDAGSVYRDVITTEIENPDDPEHPLVTKTVRYYVKDTLDISPSAYAWRVIDYAQEGAAVELPQGDSIATSVPEGYAEQPVRTGSVRYQSGDDNFYYLTTRIHLRNGEPAEEKVAYPVCQDDRGIFYTAYSLTQNEDESYSQNSVCTRVDLERTPVSYVYKDGETVVSDAENAAYVLYGPSDAQQRVRLMHSDARTEQVFDPETGEPVLDPDSGAPTYTSVPERWWIVVEAEVVPQFYTLDAESTQAQFVEESDTKLTWTASWTVQREEGVVDEFTDVEVDRYLSGVWYLLFGYEVCPGTAEGGCTHGAGGSPVGSVHEVEGILDNTDMSILDISGPMTNAVDIVNTLPLWKLWLHEFISTNPFQALPAEYTVSDGETEITYTNLNQFTMNGMIGYMKWFIANTPSLP